MPKFMERMRTATRRITGKMEQYHEAIAFAEAGQPEHSRQLLQDEESVESPSKLLVVGRESTFSREIIEYALEMAQRMSYEILALNTAPLSCETFRIFSSSQKKLCEDFQALAEENVKEFEAAATRMGIPFAHVIKFREPDEALEEIKTAHRDIEFVVSEAEEEQAVHRVQEGERVRKEIFVYSMV